MASIISVSTKPYEKVQLNNYISLDGVYKGNVESLMRLDYCLQEIIRLEAPITIEVLKERFREIFGIEKISQKLLNIILERVDYFDFKRSDNLYTVTLWPNSGVTLCQYFRTGYDRSIYNIPREELYLISIEVIANGFRGEAHNRKILEYFGGELMTEKASNYLAYIEKYSKKVLEKNYGVIV